MRFNASLSALLALAVLFLLPAALPAKPVHRHARKTATVHRQIHSRTVKPARSVSRRRSAHAYTHAQSESHTRRVHSPAPRRQRNLSRKIKAGTRRSAPRHIEVSDIAAGKATSADFLQAATGKTEIANSPASRSSKHAQTIPESRIQDRNTRRTSKTPSAATPVPVVDIVRPTAEHPQLQSIQEEAEAPSILPALYNKRGRLIVPPPLKGSREILLHQNEVADREGLDRIQNNADLLDMRSKRILVPLPASYALAVDDHLPLDRRFCRPWTSQFLSNMARAHYARFHTPLQINSAVRTVEFQQHLIHVNGNAAPAEGDTASPHLTGQAIDIAKHGLSRTEVAWMRGYLLPLIQEGRIDVEEEFQQSCFHISVYKKYLPPADVPRHDLASHRNSEASALATAIR